MSWPGLIRSCRCGRQSFSPPFPYVCVGESWSWRLAGHLGLSAICVRARLWNARLRAGVPHSYRGMMDRCRGDVVHVAHGTDTSTRRSGALFGGALGRSSCIPGTFRTFSSEGQA